MHDIKPCAICEGSGDPVEYLRLRNPVDGHRGILLRCRGCGLVYVQEELRANRSFVPDHAVDLEECWQQQFPDRVDVYGGDAWGKRLQNAEMTIEWQYDAVERLLGERIDRPGCTLIELGAARGALLARLARRHPGLQLVAIEPSPVMAAHAESSGARVINAVIEDAHIEPCSADALVSFGAFIQVRDPMSSLRCAHRVLKRGGRILLDSPNSRSLMRALGRQALRMRSVLRPAGLEPAVKAHLWRLYHPGRFYYYDKATYQMALRAAGFVPKGVRFRPARSLEFLQGSSGVRRLARFLSRVERAYGSGAWIEVTGEKA